MFGCMVIVLELLIRKWLTNWMNSNALYAEELTSIKMPLLLALRQRRRQQRRQRRRQQRRQQRRKQRKSNLQHRKNRTMKKKMTQKKKKSWTSIALPSVEKKADEFVHGRSFRSNPDLSAIPVPSKTQSLGFNAQYWYEKMKAEFEQQKQGDVSVTALPSVENGRVSLDLKVV